MPRRNSVHAAFPIFEVYEERFKAGSTGPTTTSMLRARRVPVENPAASAFSSASRRATRAAARASSTPASASAATLDAELRCDPLAELGDLVGLRRDLLGHGDDPRAGLIVPVGHERRVGHSVLVGELDEPRHRGLRLRHGLLVAGEPRRELDERGGERCGQRRRCAARRSRRALAERGEELTDSLLAQHRALRR